MSDKYSSSYVTEALETKTAAQLEKALVKYLRALRLRFDTVVFRGMSGALMAPGVARKMGKELVMVRKDDGNHSGMRVEGFKSPKRYIIVDDFVCTGATVKAIYAALKDSVMTEQRAAKCVGVVCYRGSGTGEVTLADKVHAPRYSVWPNADNDGNVTFSYEPSMPVRKPRVKKTVAPVVINPPTETEKYFHQAAGRPVQQALAIS